MRSFLVGPATAPGPNKRVHLVCPANGACTVFALLLGDLLDAGCLSDFGCLTSSFADMQRLFRNTIVIHLLTYALTLTYLLTYCSGS